MKIDVSEVGVSAVVDVTIPSFSSVAAYTTLWAIHKWGEEYLLIPVASVEEVEPLRLTAADAKLVMDACVTAVA